MSALLAFFLLFFGFQRGSQPSDENPKAPLSRQESIDMAWTVLQGGLSDKASDRRSKAVHALGLMLNVPKAEEYADKALKDENVDVRTAAANALGEMQAKSSVPQLKEALKDKQLKVVVAAANSLYEFKDPSAYEVYYAILTGERKGPGLVDSQMQTFRDKKQLEKLMIQTGFGFIPFGGMGYEAVKTLTHDDVSPVRQAAALKLANDPDPKTGEALGRACSDKQWLVRAAAVEAIAKRGDPELMFSVSPLLYDNSDNVRYESAAAILKLTSQASAAKSAAKKRR